jgi:hypothetical protein
MKEVLENIWNWIDEYVWTLALLVFIVVCIIITVCCISQTINYNRTSKKMIEGIEKEMTTINLNEKIFPLPWYDDKPRDAKGRFIKKSKL